jgi:parallel beta-helix repeat protein
MLKERPNIKKYLVLIISIILMVSLSNFSEIQSQKINIFDSSKSNTISKPVSSQMTNITVIIDGNTELEEFSGITGVGSSEDPYIIDYLQINASNDGSGIEIKNTNKYLIIQNCTVVNSGSNYETFDSGIKIENSSNVVIKNNTISKSLHGIGVLNSLYNNITDNVVSINNSFGISLDTSNYNNIFGNEGMLNKIHGLYLVNSFNNSIINNLMANNTYGSGIFLSDSEGNEIRNNIVDNNSYGLYLKKSNYNTVQENHFANNYYDCIRIYEGTGNIISDNGDCIEKITYIIPMISVFPIWAVFGFLVIGTAILILKNKRKIR